MQIIFERSGGFMGRKVSLSLDLEELPEDQAKILKRLVDESGFFDLSINPPEKSVPDEFTYSILINTETNQRTIQVGETNFPPVLRPLLENLMARTRSH